MTGKRAVIELGPHPNMSVEGCLALALRTHADLSDVIVVGYDAEDGSVVMRSSRIHRANAAFLLHAALDKARGL